MNGTDGRAGRLQGMGKSMNKFTKSLLSGVALCALTPLPALAVSHPAFTFTAVHAGRMVNKTKFHVPERLHLTYTFSVYASAKLDLGVKTQIGGLYRWNSTVSGHSTICSNPKQKMTFDSKKTLYGKLSAATETYSMGCPSGPTTYYGTDYKLTDPNGYGKTDHFRSSLIGRFQGVGGRYKGTLNIDENLTILSN
jgi:hypothetical protein